VFANDSLAVLDEVESPSWSRVAALVELAQFGDSEAFGELVVQFEPTVRRIALRRLRNPSDADELTQDVFLHAFCQLDQLREPERFAGWLRQMAHRMAINFATRRKPLPTVDSEVLGAVSGRQEGPVDEVLSHESVEALHDAINRLKPMDREALVEFHLQGRSLVAIANRLEIPVGTVKRRLHTARKRLRDELQAFDSSGDDPLEDEGDRQGAGSKRARLACAC
jgi:RNA polymerase sigma-70 factor (ECF subfamily)